MKECINYPENPRPITMWEHIRLLFRRKQIFCDVGRGNDYTVDLHCKMMDGKMYVIDIIVTGGPDETTSK